MTIIIRCVFEEDGKIYLQVFLDDALYELNKKKAKYHTIDISERIDVNKTNLFYQKNVRFVTIGILKILVLSMNHIFAMVVMS